MLFEAAEMATSETVTSGADEVVSLSKAEYQRYLACLAIIEAGLARLVASDEEG